MERTAGSRRCLAVRELLEGQPSLTFGFAKRRLVSVSTQSILDQKLRALFLDASQRREAEKELARYGTERYEQEAVRVQLAVLKLAGADVQRLRSYVDPAKGDYQDVLAWAEYPAQMETDSGRLPPAERKTLIVRDRQQYEE